MHMQDSIRRIVAVAVFVVAGAAPAFAQHEKGDKNLSGYGFLSFQKGVDTGFESSGSSTTGLIGAQIGRFISAQTEVGGVSNLIVSSGGGAGTTGSFGAYGKHYYGSDKTRPYVGVQGLVDISRSSSDFSGRGESTTSSNFRANVTAGVRHYVNRNGAVFAEANYGAVFGSGGHSFDDFPQLVFGFSVVF
jgi:hypothetical protein